MQSEKSAQCDRAVNSLIEIINKEAAALDPSERLHMYRYFMFRTMASALRGGVLAFANEKQFKLLFDCVVRDKALKLVGNDVAVVEVLMFRLGKMLAVRAFCECDNQFAQRELSPLLA